MPTRPVDMNIGPEDPRPFVELASTLGLDRIPWRRAIVVEGCGQSAMQLKDIGASFLSMFPGNADLRRAFAFLEQARAEENHISVRLRASFTTWAPVEEAAKLRRRVSTLSQRIEGWGNAKATTVDRRSAGGRDEQRARSGARVDGEPRPGAAGRRAGDAAMEPHGVALGVRKRAVPSGGRRHLAL